MKQQGEQLDIQTKMTKQQSIQRARQTTLLTPMLAEMHRRAKLKMKPGEVEGSLTFVVEKKDLLRLPPSDDTNTALLRAALFRRIDGLGARIDDDSSYYDAVERGQRVTIVLPLPSEYESGGWHCYAAIHGNRRCLHPNKADDISCTACQTPKPQLKPEFAYLRILAHAIRIESLEYVRVIQESDADLIKCEEAERVASERVAMVAKKQIENTNSTSSDVDEEDDEELMMNVELVQSVWNRVHAENVLSMMKPRKAKLYQMLSAAKAQLAIMIQHAYQLAVIHVQKVVRGFILRASLDRLTAEAIAFAEFSAAAEIQRVIRSTLATIETVRRRKMKRNEMATAIQCLIRKRAAYLERLRLWTIHFENLRRKSAIKIQSI